MTDFLDCLYLSTDDRNPLKGLGEYHKPPARFEHGRDALVAKVPKVNGGDGQPVEVYECRMPARFYKIKVLPSKNSVGEKKEGYEITTGSGDQMGELTASLAISITEGMIGFHPKARKS
jgi:hypothetical protein